MCFLRRLFCCTHAHRCCDDRDYAYVRMNRVDARGDDDCAFKEKHHDCGCKKENKHHCR